MLRMGEVNEVDHQAMQHMLTSNAIDWVGFRNQIAYETNALLGGTEAILIIDESGFGLFSGLVSASMLQNRTYSGYQESMFV